MAAPTNTDWVYRKMPNAHNYLYKIPNFNVLTMVGATYQGGPEFSAEEHHTMQRPHKWKLYQLKQKQQPTFNLSIIWFIVWVGRYLIDKMYIFLKLKRGTIFYYTFF